MTNNELYFVFTKNSYMYFRSYIYIYIYSCMYFRSYIYIHIYIYDLKYIQLFLVNTKRNSLLVWCYF